MFSRLRLSCYLKLHNYSTSSLNHNSTPRSILSLIKAETNPQRALELYRSMTINRESYIHRIALSTVVSKLSEANQFNSIHQFLEDHKNRPEFRNELFVSHTIVLYGQARMVDQAIRTFKEIDQWGVPQTVESFNALLFSCFLAKEYDQVKRVFSEFPRVYGIRINLDSFNTVIKALCESGSASSVYSILAEMDRKGIKPNATSFSIWVAGFYREEKFEEVAKVLRILQYRYGMKQNVSIYNTRIQSLCKLKRSREAKALLDGMLERKMKPNSVSFCHLVHGFCREGKFDEAKEVFTSMGEKGYQPDSECYFTIIYYLCQAEDFETALKICEESMSKNWVPYFTTMKSLINGLVSSSKVDEARKLIRQVKTKFTRNMDLWNAVEAGLPQRERPLSLMHRAVQALCLAEDMTCHRTRRAV